jgi:hypothetical protein
VGEDVAIFEAPHVVSYNLKGAAAPHSNGQALVRAFILFLFVTVGERLDRPWPAS